MLNIWYACDVSDNIELSNWYEGNGHFVSPEASTVANERCPNYTFDNYFMTPIKLINFKANNEVSALLVSVLR